MKTQKMDGFMLGQNEIFLIILKTSNSDLGSNGELERSFAFTPRVCESLGHHALCVSGGCKRKSRMNLYALDIHQRSALSFLTKQSSSF